MRQLVVATLNQHKLQEYRALLAGLPFELTSLVDLGIADDVDETGDTFEANAILKAESYRDLTGQLVLADDSGIVVDAMDGQPGVHSKRWIGGEDDDQLRNLTILERLRDVPDAQRTARYRCVIALAEPGQPTVTVSGTVEGLISHDQRGSNGFGYDPLFFVPELACTLGEASAEVKNTLSHRARAAAAAREVLMNRH